MESDSLNSLLAHFVNDIQEEFKIKLRKHLDLTTDQHFINFRKHLHQLLNSNINLLNELFGDDECRYVCDHVMSDFIHSVYRENIKESDLRMRFLQIKDWYNVYGVQICESKSAK
jgi:hypothetical protein